MTTNAIPGNDTAELDEEVVARYLHIHPDFFTRHDDLLETMHLPHGGGGTISLVERQVALLRERIRGLERRFGDLVQVARENEQLAQQLHKLTLGLLEADSLSAALATIDEILRSEFRTAHVAVYLIAKEGREGMHFADADAPVFARLSELLATRRPRCGRLSTDQNTALFPEAGERIASTVLIPLLDGARPLGLMALGSEDAERFHQGMGTLFLGYLGETVSGCLVRHLK